MQVEISEDMMELLEAYAEAHVSYQAAQDEWSWASGDERDAAQEALWQAQDDLDAAARLACDVLVEELGIGETEAQEIAR